MSLPYRTILYSAILLLFPLSSQAETKIYLGAPGYNQYKHNYYPQKNYQQYNSRYNKYNNSYSNHRYNDLSDLYRRYGNKHAYDRDNYYRNKYQNNHSKSFVNNNQRYKDTYRQGFNDGRRSKRNNRNRSHAFQLGK